MIKPKNITWDNFWDVVNLKTSDFQKDFLPTNTVFMAQAYVNLKSGHPDSCFAICHNEEIVGFTKIEYVPKGLEPFDFSEDTYYLDALMIDEKHQGKGYGKLALMQILDFMKSKPWGDACSIKTACYDENSAAGRLYENFGFARTDGFISNRKGLRVYALS